MIDTEKLADAISKLADAIHALAVAAPSLADAFQSLANATEFTEQGVRDRRTQYATQTAANAADRDALTKELEDAAQTYFNQTPPGRVRRADVAAGVSAILGRPVPKDFDTTFAAVTGAQRITKGNKSFFRIT